MVSSDGGQSVLKLWDRAVGLDDELIVKLDTGSGSGGYGQREGNALPSMTSLATSPVNWDNSNSHFSKNYGQKTRMRPYKDDLKAPDYAE